VFTARPRTRPHCKKETREQVSENQRKPLRIRRCQPAARCRSPFTRAGAHANSVGRESCCEVTQVPPCYSRTRQRVRESQRADGRIGN
jgi:hypothetical protein